MAKDEFEKEMKRRRQELEEILTERLSKQISKQTILGKQVIEESMTLMELGEQWAPYSLSQMHEIMEVSEAILMPSGGGRVLAQYRKQLWESRVVEFVEQAREMQKNFSPGENYDDLKMLRTSRDFENMKKFDEYRCVMAGLDLASYNTELWSNALDIIDARDGPSRLEDALGELKAAVPEAR